MAILKVEASPGHTRSPHVRARAWGPARFFMALWRQSRGASRENGPLISGKTSTAKALESEAYRFTFYDIIGTWKGFDSDWTVMGQ